MRQIFKKLQNEGHIDQEGAIFLRAGEKLATELEIVRHENEGLRKAIIHEKKKRKRGKAMILFKPGEDGAQSLFFSPAKVARVRQRNADMEQTERQRQQNISDKRLQRAITREEKAREAEIKRNQRFVARQAAREILAQEKAERKAVREATRIQKATEAIERKRIAVEAKAQRLRQKEAIESAKTLKKRSIEEDTSPRPQKRARTTTLQARGGRGIAKSRSDIDTTSIEPQHSSTAIELDKAQSQRRQNALWVPKSVPLRSGRSTTLPTRFMQQN